MGRRGDIQLGENTSTAGHRLRTDILYSFVIRYVSPYCYRCGKLLSRDTFSVEHTTPWLDSSDPRKTFFDLDNIAFSHLACNSAARRVYNKKYLTDEERRIARNKRDRGYRKAKGHDSEKRHTRYLRYGY